MNEFKIEQPTKFDQRESYIFLKDFLMNGVSDIGDLRKYTGDYEGWLEKLERESRGVIKDKIPTITYFVKRDEEIIGLAFIKPVNPELVREIGNIGLAIKPKERGKGYSNDILLELLKECKNLGLEEVMLTCDSKNIPSYKSILDNTGILKDEIKSTYSNHLQRYMINVEQAIENKQEKNR